MSLAQPPSLDPLLQVTETHLSNGLQVLIKEDHALPVVTVMLWYRVGSRHEQTGRTGIAHFLEHLLFKGTDRYAKGDIDRLTLRNGGYNNAFTWIDNTAYYFNFAADRWQTALDIESNRMRNCTFLPEEVEAERSVILAEWRTSKDTPDENLWDLVNATALTAHPYRNPVLGWYEDVAQVTREEIQGFYDTYYHPNNATLVVVGDVDSATALADIRARFEAIPAGPVPPVVRVREPQQQGERRITLKKPDVRVPRLYVAWPAPAVDHPDFDALALLETILTEGQSSLLYQRLVDELEVATDVDASFFATHSPYLFAIDVDLKQGKDPAKVERLLFAELDKLRSGQWEPIRLEKSRNQLQADFFFHQETTEDQAQLLGEYAAIGDWRRGQTIPERIAAITFEQVTAAAQTWLHPDRRTVGWLMPDPVGQQAAKSLLGRDKKAARRPARHGQPGGAIHIPQIQTHERTLPNGLQLCLHPFHKTPTVRIEAFIQAGSLQDPPRKQGVASLTADLLTEGTRRRTAVEISESIEFVGGDLMTWATPLGTRVSLEVLRKDLPLSVDLLQDLICAPAFKRSEVDKQRDLALADLQEAEESADYLAERTFRRLVYGDHPLSQPSEGTLDTLKLISRDDLRRFWQTWYHPNNTRIFVSGDIDPDATIALLGNTFADWRLASLPEAVMPPLAVQPPSETWLPVPGKEQLAIYLGHVGVTRSHPDFYALSLMDLILGWGPGFTSRLSRRLRDQEGLAYSLSGAITPYAGMYSGLFICQMETSLEHAERGIAGMREEVARLCAQGVTPEELADAQAYVSGSFVFGFETNRQRCNYLLQQHLYGWGYDYPAEYLERVAAVTCADIQRVAQTWLHPEQLILVAAGPIKESHSDA
jgi:zinc protease